MLVKNITLDSVTYKTDKLPKNLYVYVKINDSDFTCEFEIKSSPFLNCQNFVIANFGDLIYGFRRKYLPKDVILDLVMYIADEHANTKRLLMVDVHSIYEDSIEHIFENIKFKSPYLSTNGSKMTIYMIDLSKIKKADYYKMISHNLKIIETNN